MKNLLRLGLLPLLVALLPALTGCGKRGAAVSDTVRFGHPPNPAGTIEWAIYRGILQPELAKVGIQHILDYPAAGAGPQLNEAFAAGTLDVFATGDTPALIGRSSGLKYVLIDIDVTHTDNSIYVRADCRGYGVGKSLLSELTSLCTLRGCHSMVACICGDNVPSVALHASLGFLPIGVLPEAGRKFGKWLSLSIMQRRLAATAPPPTDS